MPEPEPELDFPELLDIVKGESLSQGSLIEIGSKLAVDRQFDN